MMSAYDDQPEPRTAEEIEQLKANWRHDACWDIEDTEGFEYHYMELRRWREAIEDETRVKEINRITTRAASLGFSYDQMRFIESLERRIQQLERVQNERGAE